MIAQIQMQMDHIFPRKRKYRSGASILPQATKALLFMPWGHYSIDHKNSQQSSGRKIKLYGTIQ